VELQIPEALLELIDNPKVTDICLTDGCCEADFGAGLVRAAGVEIFEPDLSELARELIELGGRRLDQANPFADVSLEGGLRVHAVLKSGCSEKTLISIRLHQTRSQTLEQLLTSEYSNSAERELIREIAFQGQSFLITGATGTGKTTLLRAMLSETKDRVIAIEDVTELTGENVISLQTKPKNIEGQGEITLEDLLRQALRMRPDRICIGEVRGKELLPMLQALNTGHRGATTLHANSLQQVPERILSIASLLDVSEISVARLTRSAFDWVIALKIHQGQRSIAGIGKFEIVDGELQVLPQLRLRKLALA
jgi:pilus assembly protein CpaF